MIGAPYIDGESRSSEIAQANTTGDARLPDPRPGPPRPFPPVSAPRAAAT
jgi:hypothetical protein